MTTANNVAFRQKEIKEKSKKKIHFSLTTEKNDKKSLIIYSLVMDSTRISSGATSYAYVIILR